MEIGLVLRFIELLLDAGEFETADELYRGRLENGGVFLTIPAPAEDLDCALGFVREAAWWRCQESLSLKRAVFYLNEVGRYATETGYFELALRYHTDSSNIIRELDDAKNLGIILQNESELLVIMGRLAEAARTAGEAVNLTVREGDEPEIRDCHGYRGWAACLSGQVRPAARDFAVGNEMERMGDHDGGTFYGIRSGHPAAAGRRMRSDLRTCQPYEWNADVARCRLMLG